MSEPLEDFGESISKMEPLRIAEGSRHRAEIIDIAFELVKQSSQICAQLPAGVLRALAVLLRSMNCYYSNLIEGHHTHINDIEKALNNDFSADPTIRNLQLEAKAHIQVQQWIDDANVCPNIFSPKILCAVHQRFFEALPNDMCQVHNPETNESVAIVPGALREHRVQVGRHISISPGAVPRFLNRFNEVYSGLGQTETLIAAAAAHHRLLWIHPFLDGNGRVARLMSDVILSRTLKSRSSWSISRGFARNVSTYKGLLANCDLPRRNDLDGRGALSEEALVDFIKFFFETCIDQIVFMDQLIDPERLRNRVNFWASMEISAGKLPLKSDIVLNAVLSKGKMQRRDVVGLLGVSERQARRITSALIQRSALTSVSSRAPLNPSFPASLATYWLPGLFPNE